MEIGYNDEMVLLASEFLNGPLYSRAYIYNGTTWDPLGELINPDLPTVDGSNSYHKLEIGSDGTIYAALAHTGTLNIYAWDGASWNIISEGIAGSELNVFDLSSHSNGNLYAYYADGLYKANCSQWDGTEWTMLGIPSFTKTLLDISGYAYKEGNPGMLYTDNYESIGKLSAKRYEQVYSSVKDEPLTNTRLEFFPNPVGDVLSINLENTSVGPYYIFDRAGKIVQTQKPSNNQINVEDLKAGYYILFLPSENKYGSFIKI